MILLLTIQKRPKFNNIICENFLAQKCSCYLVHRRNLKETYVNVTAELSTATEEPVDPETSVDCHAHNKHREGNTQTNSEVKRHSNILSSVASLGGGGGGGGGEGGEKGLVIQTSNAQKRKLTDN